MRKLLVVLSLLAGWGVAGLVTLWLILVTAGTWNYLVVGASNAYDDYDVRVYSSWEGWLFQSAPDRVTVTFSTNDAGRFRYRPKTGMIVEVDSDSHNDASQIGVLSSASVAARVAQAMPEQEEEYQVRFAEDVVRLVETASGKGLLEAGGGEDWDALAAEDGSLPPAAGYNILRPQFGGQSPVSARTSVDWTVLLIPAPTMVALCITVPALRRIRRREE